MKAIALISALALAASVGIAQAQQHEHDHGAAASTAPAAAQPEQKTAQPERAPDQRPDRDSRRSDRDSRRGDRQHGSSQMPGMASHSNPAKGDTGPSSAAFAAINAQMHEGMNIPFTGNADVDFVKGMIPHHQGAIDMAKVVIAFGKDAQIRKLAEDVIKAQEGEIATMREWLARQGK